MPAQAIVSGNDVAAAAAAKLKAAGASGDLVEAVSKLLSGVEGGETVVFGRLGAKK